MLAALAHIARGSRRTEGSRDERSVADVVCTASACIGESDAVAACVVATLEEHGVRFAWQLREADSDDWARYGAQDGFKLAIKAELAHPSSVSSTAPRTADAGGLYTCYGEEVTERLQRFLLLPRPDGSAAKPMGAVTVTFAGILLIAPEDRQNLIIILCELLALVGGLMAPIPISLLSQRAAPADKGWGTFPREEDGMDAVAIYSFLGLVTVIWMITTTALSTAAGGWNAPIKFYEAYVPSGSQHAGAVAQPESRARRAPAIAQPQLCQS